jgi:all-trans-8'-apo-beta-carotenal 15,15'-oxygenase
MLSRRQFLRVSAAAGASSVLGCGLEAGSLIPPDGAGFPASTLSGSRAELDADLEVLAGELPRDIVGHALVVASLPYGDGTPLFTGDGMIYRLSFGGGRARLLTRLVRTPCFAVDEAAGTDERLRFRNSGFVRISQAFGARNFGNTALVPIQDGRLLATYDAGRPWEIDPETLEVITPVGLQSSWRPFLPPVTPGLDFFTMNMATAHPGYDPGDRVTYVVNYATPVEGLDIEPFVRLLWWDGATEPSSTTLVDEHGQPVTLLMSCHQMQVTERFVILLDGAFQIEPEQMAGGDVTRAQIPESVLYFIRKSDLADGGTTVATRIVIPIESTHFQVARADAGDRVTLLLSHQNSADPSEWVRASDTVAATGQPVDPSTVTMLVAPADKGLMGRYVVDVAAAQVVEQATMSEWTMTLWSQDLRTAPAGLGTGFWSSIGFDPALLTQRIVDVYADHPYRQVPIAELPVEPIPGGLLRVDQDALAVTDRFAMPRGYLPMSPTFVPRDGGGRDDGYLMVFAIGPAGDEVWLFDAGDLGYGPICRLGHPELDVPFTLHSTWMGELRRQSSPVYVAEPQDDYGPRLDALDPAARELARRVLGLA